MAETNNNKNNEVIDLLMSDNDDDDLDNANANINNSKKKQQKQQRHTMKDPPSSSSASLSGATNNKTERENKKNGKSNKKSNYSKINNNNKRRTTKMAMAATKTKTTTIDGLQAGLVLEEDVFASSAATAAVRGNEGEDYHSDYDDNDNINSNNNTQFELFEDDEFGPVASSIMGIHKPSIVDINLDDDDDDDVDNTDEDDVKVESSSSSSSNKKKKKKKKKTTENDSNNNNNNKWNPKCRCKMLARLSYREKDGTPYFQCGKVISTKKNPKNKCKFFTYAFKAELTVWYRFGHHNRHVLVQQQQQQQQQTLPSSLLLPSNTNNNNSNDNSNSLFSAQDLVQGTVCDCWFLSALAVVAERPDLIRRLFQQQQQQRGNSSSDDLQNGIIRVNLFLDGIWSQVKMDNFLPCYIRGNDEDDDDLQRALEASLLSMNGGDNEKNNNNNNNSTILRNPYKKKNKNPNNNNQQYTKFPPASSRNDPNGLSERNRQIMIKATEFIDRDRGMKQQHGGGGLYRPRLLGFDNASRGSSSAQAQSQVAQTRDLAYSKAHKNQLWVPFLEKAYAKIHGSYQAISGGQIAEAFLDLTGAPTLQIGWHAGRAASGMNSTSYDDPKRLWFDLLKWRKQRLPMGCGTDKSAEGLVGMHAYSILDISEITNVGVDFFKDRLIRGTLGNVSGFTEYDGKVRLLRIRNPHGQGEWKGEFSDKCAVWKQLLTNSGITLPRSGINDGTFWIGYDDFLLGFSNIDVVLAHQGNHAKSFVSNFPQKINNHRCTRAFEVSLIDPQPGLETKERVEVYVMGIQKSKRGARQGRKDRKKSYKVSDMGMLVGEYPLNNNGGSENNNSNDNDDGADANYVPFSTVHGQMFGFKRNGHYKIVLDRKKCKRLVVMPISFGHPAATDALLSFVVRFNADAPLMIRELEEVPRMDRVLCDFLIRPKPSGHFSDTRQGQKKILWQNPHYRVVQINCFGNRGGTVFVYLCASPSAEDPISLGVEATCRGMSCRVEAGPLDHETLAKGKKFEAAWRKFKCDFIGQIKSQLLMVLYQSGQDTEMGSIIVKPVYTLGNGSNTRPTPKLISTTLDRYWKTNTTGNGGSASNEEDAYEYKLQGVFNPIRIDDDTFLHCGVNREVFESSSRAISMSGQGQYHPYGELLDGDAELQQALALSRQGHGVPDDSKDLEEALKRSCQDKEGRGTTTEDIDTELEDALRRSREDAFGRKQGSSLKQTIDLTMKKAAKSNKNDNAIVLDLTDTSDNPTHLTIDGSINNSKENPVRRENNCEEGGNQEIVILDSDEEDSNDTKAQCEEKGKRKDIEEPSSSSQDREKKRKLAADAALKRLEGRL